MLVITYMMTIFNEYWYSGVAGWSPSPARQTQLSLHYLTA